MSSKRKHGTGSVWAYRGRWRGEVMIDGERHGCVEDTNEQAWDTLRGIIQRHTARAADLPTSITLREWGEVWLQRRTQDGVRGVSRERSRWNRHVMAAPFADRAIKSIDRADVVAWMRSLMHVEAADAVTSPVTGKTSLRATGRKLSTQTVKHCVTLLRLAMRDALEESRIRRNPAEGVKPPTRQSRTTSPRSQAWSFLSREEVALATSAEVAEPYRTIYTVAIFAGLRREELWSLRWSDVHLDGDRPRIDVLVSKNDRPREVPLLPAATEALRRWRAMRPGVGGAYVFPVLSGKHRGERHPATYDGRWRDYVATSKRGERKRMPGWCRRAGIERHVRFHDLRHTCASHLVMGTLDASLGPMTLVEVGKWLGHSGPSVTARYAHLAPDALHGKVRRAREEQGEGDTRKKGKE